MERQRYLRTVNEDTEDNGLHSAAHRYSNSEDDGQEEPDARQSCTDPNEGLYPMRMRPVSAPKERPTSAPSKTSRKSGGVNLSSVPTVMYVVVLPGEGSTEGKTSAGSTTGYLTEDVARLLAQCAPECLEWGSPKRRRLQLSVNVSSLLHRDKEALAEEVVSLRRKLHDIEDVHLRTCTENRRITTDLQRTEQMLSQLEAEHSACSRGFDQLIPGSKNSVHVADGPSNASLVRKLKSALKDQKSLNADLEAELMRVNELEAEKLTYLAETKRLTKLLSRKQHAASPEKGAVVFDDEEPPPTARSSASPQASPRVPAAEQSTEQIYKAPQVLVSHVDTGRSVTKVSKSGMETKELKRRIKEMDKSHRALHDQAAGMRAHLEEVENKLARAQASVAANKTASAKAKMAQAQVTQLQEEVKGLQGELAYIQKHPPVPTTSGKDKEMQELRDRQERLEQQRHALKAALKARDEDVLKLQQEVENAGAKPSTAADPKIVEKHRQAVLHMREELALQEEELMHCRNQVPVTRSAGIGGLQPAASPPAPEAEAAAPDLPEAAPAAASGEPKSSVPLSPEASALPPSAHDAPDGDLDGDLDEDDLGMDDDLLDGDLGPEPQFEGEDTDPLDAEPEPALDTGDLSGGEGSFIGSDEGSLP
eukprot:gene8869-10512_t